MSDPTAVTFAQEKVSDCAAEAWPLLEAHWREIAHYQDIALDPDWSLYAQAEDAGIVRLYTVRDGGRLVGYALFFVRANGHYRQSVQAVQDILYLDPALRGHLLGARFIRWCDEQLRAEHVQVVYHHFKAAHDFGPLLERLGYEFVDKVYARRLDWLPKQSGKE